jgi:imidazolonepropionase-like amidohydrolase
MARSLTIIFILLALVLPGNLLQAQQNHFVVMGGTAHTGNGAVIENAWMEFKDGFITEISSFGMREIPAGAVVIDARGKHIYPGIIACNTTLGLIEIDRVRATDDKSDVGSLRPHVRSLIAYNADSRQIPTLRSNGILITQVVPQGGLVSGRSSVMYTQGWNWQDAVVKEEDGVHVRWPVMHANHAWWASDPANHEKNNIYDNQTREIMDFFADAKAYAASDKKTRVLQLEAVAAIFTGKQRLYIHANAPREIASAVLWATGIGAQPVIVGGRGAEEVSSLLKQHDVPVILGNLQSLPDHRYSPVDENFSQAKRLYDAGIRFALSLNDSWQQRNLPFIAGTAVAYGLPYEEAVKAITGAAAQIIGIDDLYGTLEKGKSATLIISEGDLLDIRSSKVEKAFINGVETNLDDDHQKMMYRKFRQKYIDQGIIKP